jgi:hypothetical protein
VTGTNIINYINFSLDLSVLMISLTLLLRIF